MPRMRILSATEQEPFDKPPVFDAHQRKQFFEFPKAVLETAMTLRGSVNQLGFLISCGYFKAAKRFFAPCDFHTRDSEYVARHQGLSEQDFSPEKYTETSRRRHKKMIREFYGFQSFDDEAEQSVILEITAMVQSQLKPKLIFFRCIDHINSFIITGI